MTKRLIIILAVAFMIGLSLSAYAEVQNVKVSGDLLMRAIHRANFTLLKDSDKYSAGGITSQVRVRVDADLTDNVSATIRLLNEKSWGDTVNLQDAAYNDEIGSAIGDVFMGKSEEILIDLAYVQLKEFLYSPLTLTIGRQELRFGNGLIIGDVDTNMLSNSFAIPLDLSLKKSFDAIRATLDYTPWVLDLVYAKIAEHDIWWYTSGDREDNDTDLWGMNASLDTTNALGFEGKLDLYYWLRMSKYLESVDPTDSRDECNTIGALLSGKILKNLTGSLEYAYQFGTIAEDPTDFNLDGSDRKAFALQAGLKYLIDTEKHKAKAPTVGVSYTHLSGDNRANGTHTRWDPMFEDQIPNNVVNAMFPNTGTQNINLMGSIKPTEDSSLAVNFGYYWLSKKPKVNGEIFGVYENWTTRAGKLPLGMALDLTGTYDYTEDVQFGLTYGIFTAGKALKDAPEGYKGTASQFIGSMKVTF